MANTTDFFKPGPLRRVETTGRHRQPDPVPPTPKRPVSRPRKRQRLDPEVETVNTHESASVELQKDAVQFRYCSHPFSLLKFCNATVFALIKRRLSI